MNAHTATPDRPNPVIELIRRLRKATHRPEPANDPTVCVICGAPLTDSTSSICPDCAQRFNDQTIGTIHIRRDHRDKLSPYLLEYQSTDLKEDQA